MMGSTASMVATRRPRKPRAPAFLLAMAALVAAAMLLPLVYLVIRTLGSGSEVWGLLIRLHTLKVLGRTLALVLTVTAASTALALPLAWFTVRANLPGRRAWAVLTALPLAIPSYVGAFILVSALGPRGMLQQTLGSLLGIERLPDIYGFPGAAVTLTLLSYPYMLLSVRAALFRMDPALEETARSLGTGPRSTFRRVVLPQLRPAIAAGGLLVALYTISDFGAVSLLRYETFTWSIYLQYESAFDRTAAATLSLALVTLALGILVFEAATRGKGRYHSARSGRPATQVPLGLWKWPAFAFCAAVVLFALLLPVSVLGYWLLRGLAAGETLGLMWTPALKSVYVASLAMAANVAAGLPVAVLAVRHPGRLAWLLERTSYIGFALPGVVVALALVFFGANYTPRLYQTLVMLVFAYVILFLPTTVGAIRASLLQVNPNLEDAARSLGRHPLRVLLSVTLPLVRSGLLGGAALAFLVTIKELPATLILSPTGFETLAMSVWSSATEAFFARAAAPALLLVLASSLSLAILLSQERRGQR